MSGESKAIFEKDSDALTAVRTAFDISDEYQSQKFDEYERAYQDYKGYQNMTGKDPFLAYPKSPLPYAIVESQTARDISAVFDKTPWVELKALLPENKGAAQDFQETYQCLSEMGDLKKVCVSAAKMKRLYGLSFLETTPEWIRIKTVESQPRMVGGLEVSTEDVPVVIDRFRLKFKAFAPWEIYRDPFAEDLKSSRWVIKMTLVSRRELIKMAERGTFGEDFDIGKLKSSADMGKGESTNKDWGVRMRESIGLAAPQEDSDVSVLVQFESPDRYIDIWDFRVVLRDQDNPFDHGQVNLTAFINNYDPNPKMRFDGISELKSVEQVIGMHSMALAQLVNNHQFSQHKTLLYRQGSVEPDTLVMRPGGRIAVTSLLPNMPLDAGVRELPHTPLSPDDYNVPAMLEQIVRTNTGVFKDDEGDSNPSIGTATEAALNRQQSDSRKKLTIDMFDRQLAEVADLAFSHMSQFMSPLDWGNIIGSERAQQMEVTHPQHIPGGCQFQFNSADRETERLIKRQGYTDLLGIYGGVQAPMVLQQKLLELYGLPEHDIQAFMQELQQQQQAAQEAAQSAEQNELSADLNKKDMMGKVDNANSIEKQVTEVALGLKALPGEKGTKPASQAKAKRK